VQTVGTKVLEALLVNTSEPVGWMGWPELMSVTVAEQFEVWPIWTEDPPQDTETEASLFPAWSCEVAEPGWWSASPPYEAVTFKAWADPGVSGTEHEPETRAHLTGSDPPVGFWEKATLPVGATGVPLPESATLAVQVVLDPLEQMRATKEERCDAVSWADPEPDARMVLPE
jgi:hypothetical protein